MLKQDTLGRLKFKLLHTNNDRGRTIKKKKKAAFVKKLYKIKEDNMQPGVCTNGNELRDKLL